MPTFSVLGNRRMECPFHEAGELASYYSRSNEIRRRFQLSAADRLEWIIDEAGIRVVPVKKDPIAAFRGQGKGGATERLIAERQRDLRNE